MDAGLAETGAQAVEQQDGLLAQGADVIEQHTCARNGGQRTIGNQPEGADVRLEYQAGQLLTQDRQQASGIPAGLAEHQFEPAVGAMCMLEDQLAMVDGGVSRLQPAFQAGKQSAGGEQQGLAVMGGCRQLETVAERICRFEPGTRVGHLAACARQTVAHCLGAAARQPGCRQVAGLAEAVQAKAGEQGPGVGVASGFVLENGQWQLVDGLQPVLTSGVPTAGEPARGQGGGSKADACMKAKCGEAAGNLGGDVMSAAEQAQAAGDLE